VDACFNPFRDNVCIGQDRCTICIERTIGSQIILTHPMVVLGDVGQVEARFGPFGDSVNLETR
jgi:hypothetical protein